MIKVVWLTQLHTFLALSSNKFLLKMRRFSCFQSHVPANTLGQSKHSEKKAPFRILLAFPYLHTVSHENHVQIIHSKGDDTWSKQWMYKRFHTLKDEKGSKWCRVCLPPAITFTHLAELYHRKLPTFCILEWEHQLSVNRMHCWEEYQLLGEACKFAVTQLKW